MFVIFPSRLTNYSGNVFRAGAGKKHNGPWNLYPSDQTGADVIEYKHGSQN
jgi:hypothetical protein